MQGHNFKIALRWQKYSLRQDRRIQLWRDRSRPDGKESGGGNQGAKE